jgi:hypothetical protein
VTLGLSGLFILLLTIYFILNTLGSLLSLTGTIFGLNLRDSMRLSRNLPVSFTSYLMDDLYIFRLSAFEQGRGATSNPFLSFLISYRGLLSSYSFFHSASTIQGLTSGRSNDLPFLVICNLSLALSYSTISCLSRLNVTFLGGVWRLSVDGSESW